jgi:LacI family transcriptional regulator
MRDGLSQDTCTLGGTTEGGYRAAVEAIRKGRLPTAFIIANDSFAVGALRAFSEAGIRVPEEVSMISFDNTRLAETAIPPLSSFELDPAEAGRQAVQLLLERIHGRRTPIRVTIPSRLVVRQSFTIPREIP